MCEFYFLALVLLPILLTDMINPVLLAAVLYGLGSNRPVGNSWAVILGFFLSYFLAGIAIALAFEAFIDSFELTERFAYLIEFCVALLLILIGWSQLKAGDTHPEEQLPHKRRMSFSSAAFLGLQANIIALPFAVPYLAAIDQILKADLEPWPATGTLLLYNLLYALPFAAMIAVKRLFKERGRMLLEGFNRFVHILSVRYLPWIFIALALLLLEDCISFLLGYREYSFLSLF